jgi:uncharacterized protein YjiS (DUF1127 family)
MTFPSVVALIALKEASSEPARSAAPSRTNSPHRVRSSLRLDVLRRFLAWRQRRATRIVLSALDDRTLRDIGVERNDIHAIASSTEISRER